jgi:hypothetical protein
MLTILAITHWIEFIIAADQEAGQGFAALGARAGADAHLIYAEARGAGGAISGLAGWVFMVGGGPLSAQGGSVRQFSGNCIADKSISGWRSKSSNSRSRHLHWGQILMRMWRIITNRQ